MQQNKYGIGGLVNIKSNKTLIWKIVEVWDIGFIASVTGKILPENKYVITNIPEQEVRIVNEPEIDAVNSPTTVKESIPTTTKKSK